MASTTRAGGAGVAGGLVRHVDVLDVLRVPVPPGTSGQAEVFSGHRDVSDMDDVIAPVDDNHGLDPLHVAVGAESRLHHLGVAAPAKAR